MGKGDGQAAHQPAQGVVPQRRGGHANGDFEAVFHLKRPQPALLTLLASGYSPIYPCHVPPAQMRTHPIGTGPFKFVELQAKRIHQGRSATPITGSRAGRISTASNTTIIPNRSTAILGFVAGQVRHDLALCASRPPLVRDIAKQAPNAICVLATNNGTTNLIINRDKPPFDNPDLRKALMLAIDRKAFIDIMTEGEGKIGGRDAAAAGGVVGHAAGDAAHGARLRPRRARRTATRRARSCKSWAMGRTRSSASRSRRATSPTYRDPAVILIDQLKEIYIDAVLDTVETANWYSQDLSQGLYRSASTIPAAASTTRTSNSTRTTLAARCATTAAIATPTSTRNSTSSR